MKITYYFRCIRATAYRFLLENWRAYPWGFVMGRILTSLFYIGTAYLLHNSLFNGKVTSDFYKYTGSNDYLTFIVIGVGVLAYANGALLSLGRSLILEQRMGTLESLCLTPASQVPYLIGVMLQQLLLVTVDFLIIIIISLFFGTNFSNTNWMGFVIALLIGNVGLTGMGILMSAVMLYLRDTYVTQNTVLLALFFISGVIFPVQYLPTTVQGVAQFIPLTHILKLARDSALLNANVLEQTKELSYLLILSIMYCALGIFLLNKVRRIALEQALS